MKFNRFYQFTALASVIFLTACSSSVGQNGNTAQNISNSGQLTPVSETSHDWGDINIRGGDVSHTFRFENTGSEPLYLKGARTSCMCTATKYRFDNGSVSPVFGMHTKLGNWSSKVMPGGRFEVETTFDPMAHGPNAVGPIRREIMLFTSDTNASSAKLNVSANVLSKKDYEKQYL